MEVGRIVVAEVHQDGDAVERADSGHPATVRAHRDTFPLPPDRHGDIAKSQDVSPRTRPRICSNHADTRPDRAMRNANRALPRGLFADCLQQRHRESRNPKTTRPVDAQGIPGGGAEGIRTPDPLTASHLWRIPAGPGSSRFVAPAWGLARSPSWSVLARPEPFSGIRDQDVISRAQFGRSAHAHRIDSVDPVSQAHLAVRGYAAGRPFCLKGRLPGG